MSSYKIIKGHLDSDLLWISNNLLIDMLIWFHMANITHAAVAAYTLKCSKYGLVLYLLNQWMCFDQACIDTLLGGGKYLIRFW